MEDKISAVPKPSESFQRRISLSTSPISSLFSLLSVVVATFSFITGILTGLFYYFLSKTEMPAYLVINIWGTFIVSTVFIALMVIFSDKDYFGWIRLNKMSRTEQKGVALFSLLQSRPWAVVTKLREIDPAEAFYIVEKLIADDLLPKNRHAARWDLVKYDNLLSEFQKKDFKLGQLSGRAKTLLKKSFYGYIPESRAYYWLMKLFEDENDEVFKLLRKATIAAAASELPQEPRALEILAEIGDSQVIPIIQSDMFNGDEKARLEIDEALRKLGRGDLVDYERDLESQIKARIPNELSEIVYYATIREAVELYKKFNHYDFLSAFWFNVAANFVLHSTVVFSHEEKDAEAIKYLAETGTPKAAGLLWSLFEETSGFHPTDKRRFVDEALIKLGYEKIVRGERALEEKILNMINRQLDERHDEAPRLTLNEEGYKYILEAKKHIGKVGGFEVSYTFISGVASGQDLLGWDPGSPEEHFYSITPKKTHGTVPEELKSQIPAMSNFPKPWVEDYPESFPVKPQEHYPLYSAA